MSRNRVPFLASLAATALVSAAACFSGGSHNPPQSTGGDDGGVVGDDAGPLPFQADPAAVYVAKVKDILVGLPPTDAEIAAVQKDPTQLGALIDQWRTSAQTAPLYTAKMMRFFELAFQQTQVTYTDYADQAYPRQLVINPGSTSLLVQNLQESFARTMLAYTAQNAPLTQAVTTHQLMMTTALMETYAFLDVYEVEDDGTVVDYFKKSNPGMTINVSYKSGPIDIKQTLDKSNTTTYMHWYDPDVMIADQQEANCTMDPIVYPVSALTLHWLLTGSLEAHLGTDGTTRCTQYSGKPGSAQLTAADFADWRMITIRPPKAGEPITQFYDLPTLRDPNLTEIVLDIPRVGFYSTPAFFANWQTNTSNQMRVTMNQALIVALGSQVDGTDTTAPKTTPGLDAMHASQAACFQCHQQLDTTRSIFASTFSWNYHTQLENIYSTQPGLFAFRGVINDQVRTIDDFANTVATHPYFASAWVQKLCYYANSGPCDDGQDGRPLDPLFQQIVMDFTKSGYNWDTLVRELLSSPIITNASQTQTEMTQGEIVAVARRDHLCAALNARLGFNDVCGLDALGKYVQQGAIPEIVSGLPSDGYGRGSTIPVLPNAPTLFYRAGLENICENVAQMTIDVPMAKQVPGVKQWSSANSDAAIADFVSILLGFGSADPRTPQATALLQSHFTAAKQQTGSSPTAALQSTFVAACLAPSFDSIGM